MMYLLNGSTAFERQAIDAGWGARRRARRSQTSQSCTRNGPCAITSRQPMMPWPSMSAKATSALTPRWSSKSSTVRQSARCGTALSAQTFVWTYRSVGFACALWSGCRRSNLGFAAAQTLCPRHKAQLCFSDAGCLAVVRPWLCSDLGLNTPLSFVSRRGCEC